MVPQRKVRAQRGFTMIEVMLVVVIIGIISSIAIPYYTRMSARAYRSEALTVMSKLEVYFKNIYDNQTTYMGTAVVAAPDVMPDPGNTIPVGQGADWKPVSGHGWDDLPFPPQGLIRMRYLYSVGTTTKTGDTIQVMACGNFPGFGPAAYSLGGSGVRCNYTMTDTIVANGATLRTENPVQTFE